MLRPSGRIFQEVLHRVLEAAGLPRVERAGKKRPYVRFHDLRHTFASYVQMGLGDLRATQVLLGHADPRMTQRYAHLSDERLREAVRALSKLPGSGTGSGTGQASG